MASSALRIKRSPYPAETMRIVPPAMPCVHLQVRCAVRNLRIAGGPVTSQGCVLFTVVSTHHPGTPDAPVTRTRTVQAIAYHFGHSLTPRPPRVGEQWHGTVMLLLYADRSALDEDLHHAHRWVELQPERRVPFTMGPCHRHIARVRWNGWCVGDLTPVMSGHPSAAQVVG